jgi:hypothetical protein
MSGPQETNLPSWSAVLADFRKNHPLDRAPASTTDLPIYWATCAITLLTAGYGEHSERLISEPTSAVLLNMVHRTYEPVEGALVAFATGCGASSEVIARAAIELSASVLYILAEDRRRRLIAYFADYVDEVTNQVQKWRSLAERLPAPVRDFLCSLSPIPGAFPKLFER